MSDHIVMMTAVGSEENAETIASTLVSERLAACVQAFQIRSHYVWNGKSHAEPETLLLIKTRKAQEAAVEARIRALHTYELPEVTSVPITFGSPTYLNWIDENTQ